MEAQLVLGLLVSFVVGIVSSLCATWLLVARRRSRFRFRFKSIVTLIAELNEHIKKDGYKYDYIVALGRNSGVVGSILAGMVGLDSIISFTMVKQRLADGNRSIALDSISESILPKLSNKRLLVLLCCNDSGASLKYVVDRLDDITPPPTSIRTAALYTSPSPMFMPTYAAVKVSKDTSKTMTQVLEGLPWVNPKWIHPFRSERNPERVN